LVAINRIPVNKYSHPSGCRCHLYFVDGDRALGSQLKLLSCWAKYFLGQWVYWPETTQADRI